MIYYILVTLCLCWAINQTGKVLIYYFNAWVVNKLFKHLHKYTLFCLIYFMSCTKQKSHKSTNPTTQCRANSEHLNVIKTTQITNSSNTVANSWFWHVREKLLLNNYLQWNKMVVKYYLAAVLCKSVLILSSSNFHKISNRIHMFTFRIMLIIKLFHYLIKKRSM